MKKSVVSKKVIRPPSSSDSDSDSPNDEFQKQIDDLVARRIRERLLKNERVQNSPKVAAVASKLIPAKSKSQPKSRLQQEVALPKAIKNAAVISAVQAAAKCKASVAEPRMASLTKTYKRKNDSELSVEEGDLVTVINSKRPDLWYVQDSDGNKGYVAAQILKEIKSGLIGAGQAVKSRVAVLESSESDTEEEEEDEEEEKEEDDEEDEEEDENEDEEEDEEEETSDESEESEPEIQPKHQFKKASVKTPVQASVKPVKAPVKTAVKPPFQTVKKAAYQPGSDSEESLSESESETESDEELKIRKPKKRTNKQFIKQIKKVESDSDLDDEIEQALAIGLADMKLKKKDAPKAASEAKLGMKELDLFGFSDDDDDDIEVIGKGGGGQKGDFFMADADMMLINQLMEEEAQVQAQFKHFQDNFGAAGQAQSFECGVCGEMWAMSGCASVGCEHQFCRECMHGYIASRIGDNQLQDFKCPAPDCDRVADQATVELFLDADDFSKLQELQLRKMAGELPEVYYCPKAQCGKLAEVIADCMAECTCGFLFCTNCNQPYHGGLDCGLSEEERKFQLDTFVEGEKAKEEERKREAERVRKEETERQRANEKAQEKAETEMRKAEQVAERRRAAERTKKAEETEKKRVAERRRQQNEMEQRRQAERERKKREDAAAERLIKGQCKKCPGCRADIMKNSGCNHMICHCGTHFCWNCLRTLDGSEKGMQDHYRGGCVYFTEDDLIY